MPKQMNKGGGKIFGIGLSKTGTTALYAALHELGFRSGTFGHLKELGLDNWRRGDFSTDYLRDFDAVTDLPIGLYYPQLDKRYPESKFVLTTRDLKSWLASCKSQFMGNPNPAAGFHREVRIATYGVTSFNEPLFRYVYESHRRNVEWYFRHRLQDLLIMDICGGDGWEALCAFLGKEIPQMPFPNVKPGYRV